MTNFTEIFHVLLSTLDKTLFISNKHRFSDMMSSADIFISAKNSVPEIYYTISSCFSSRIFILFYPLWIIFFMPFILFR